RRLLEVLEELLLGDVEDLELQRRAGLGLVEEVAETPPGALETLEVGVVQDLVELEGDDPVDLGDAGVEHRLGVRLERDGAFHHLFDEAAHEAPAPPPLLDLGAEAPLIDDLVEET